MTINTDIQFHYSGAAGTAVASLGGAIHANLITTSQDENAFANVGSAEAIAGSDKYFCFYVKNNGAVTYTNVGIYISSETLSFDTKIYVSIGSAGKNAVEQSIANNTTEPLNIIWQRPLFNYSFVPIPNLAVGDYHAIWLKRNVLANTAGSVNDYFRLSMVGT